VSLEEDDIPADFLFVDAARANAIHATFVVADSIFLSEIRVTLRNCSRDLFCGITTVTRCHGSWATGGKRRDSPGALY